MKRNEILLNVMRLLVYCSIATFIGFSIVRVVYYWVETRPDEVCAQLKKSFKENDSFEYKSCRLKYEQDFDVVYLKLKIKDEMLQYFSATDSDIDDESLTESQRNFYCSEFFDRTRVDELKLTIRDNEKDLQVIHVTRNVCD